MLKLNIAGIPEELKKNKQWVGFEIGKNGKKPIDPKSIGGFTSYASISDPSTWGTFEEAVNIRRLNFIIVQQSPQTMTLQKVIGIYEALFNNIRDLFIYTFIDNYDAWFEQLKEYDPECIDSVYKMYIREADAVMCILNSTDKNIIKHVLRELMATCFYKHLTSDDLRYSLRSIAPVEGINNLVVESMIEMEQFEKAYIL